MVFSEILIYIVPIHLMVAHFYALWKLVYSKRLIYQLIDP